MCTWDAKSFLSPKPSAKTPHCKLDSPGERTGCSTVVGVGCAVVGTVRRVGLRGWRTVLGAVPPVDFLAVCFVLVILTTEGIDVSRREKIINSD